MVLSLIQDEKPKGSLSYLWKVLLRTKSDDLHYEVLAPTRAEALKALQNAVPALQNVELHEAKSADLCKELQHMEERLLIPAYKFGVVYCKQDQSHENDMFSNQQGSKEFHEFMDLLGDKIKLKGWSKYRGGLDVVENTTGSHSYFTSHRNFDVMYHVSTMLPYSTQNMQQLERKRHIGNDVVVIVFQDSSVPPFKPSTITSKFNHVYIVVQVVKDSTKRSKKDKSSMTKSAPPQRKLVSSTTVSTQNGQTEERSSSLTTGTSPSKSGGARDRSASHARKPSNTGAPAQTEAVKRLKTSKKGADTASLRSEPSRPMTESPNSSPVKKKRRPLSQERPASPQTQAKRDNNKRAQSQLRVTSPEGIKRPRKGSERTDSRDVTPSKQRPMAKSDASVKVQKAISTPMKQATSSSSGRSSSPTKGERRRSRYRIAVVSKNGVRPFGPVLPKDKLWECNLELREFLLTKLFNAERAAYYAPGFAQTRTRRLWLMDLLQKYGPPQK